MENRDEYRKVFDYEPDYFGTGQGGVGLNLDMLFGARRNRQMLALKRRLVEEEEDKYVDFRFNRTLIHRITGLQRPALDSFMRMYRPTYDFIKSCENDYEFYKYIKDCSVYFLRTYRVDMPPILAPTAPAVHSVPSAQPEPSDPSEPSEPSPR